ncbi:MAG: hypothetical protein AAGL89_10900 [Pseudomonadota bacterium]
MLSGLTFTFVILPCIAAVAISAVLRDWRLAAAAICGGLALAFIAPGLPGGLGLLGLPIFVGIALGGLAMVLALPRRPDMDVWGRMLTALIVAFAVTFLNLLLTANGL